MPKHWYLFFYFIFIFYFFYFFNGKFMAKFSIFLNIPGPHFQNSFVPIIFFYVFCAKLKDGTQKSYKKPNTSVKLALNKTF